MDPNLIFDVGMHTGQDSAFYVRKGFRVVAIEANPLLCKEVSEQLREHIADGKLEILNVGVAERSGTLDFYINDTHSHWSSFEERLGARLGAYHVVPVEAQPLSKIIAEHGIPYYVKIDIEGLDRTALEDMLKAGQYPRYVSVENPSRILVDLLVAHGFDRFKLVNQANVSETKLPNPALEGQYIEHVFPFGASGPFGEETSGEWLTAEQASDQADAYWAQPDFDPVKHGWFDLHARRAG